MDRTKSFIGQVSERAGKFVFVPEDEPALGLRLTDAGMAEPVPPESREIDLTCGGCSG